MNKNSASKIVLCIICFFIIGSLSIDIYAQQRERILKQIELPVYEITVQKVIDMLDSVILKQQKSDTTLNNPFLHVSYIKKDPDDDMYLISIYQMPFFTIEDTSDYWGVFYIRDTPFVITKGCNPESRFGNDPDNPHFLFKEVSLKTTLRYYSTDPPFWGFVDPEHWTFFYAFKGIIYIELPEILLDRIGFVPCE